MQAATFKNPREPKKADAMREEFLFVVILQPDQMCIKWKKSSGLRAIEDKLSCGLDVYSVEKDFLLSAATQHVLHISRS